MNRRAFLAAALGSAVARALPGRSAPLKQLRVARRVGKLDDWLEAKGWTIILDPRMPRNEVALVNPKMWGLYA